MRISDFLSAASQQAVDDILWEDYVRRSKMREKVAARRCEERASQRRTSAFAEGREERPHRRKPQAHVGTCGGHMYIGGVRTGAYSVCACRRREV